MSKGWLDQPARGNRILIEFLVWVALRLGRPTARVLLYPICAYFVAFPRKASKGLALYLERVLGRSANIRDLFRHYYCFASTVLDRVYMLTDRFHLFDVDIHGGEILFERVVQGQGFLLLGAHLGSFDIVRASRIKYFHELENLPIKILMYEETTWEISQILHKLNPRMSQATIPIGSPDTMLQVKEALDRGELVGILGDRTGRGDKVVSCKFFGKEMNFPAGPMILASIVKVPVFLFFGLYMGRNRYEIYFEPFIEELTVERHCRDQVVQEWTQRYVDRLEFYCRKAPYNWFNFFDYWNEMV